jgi:prophage regulatory protein
MTNLILRLPAVKERTGLSRSSIYLWIARGQFPAPVSLGARAVGWVESEVDEWLAQRITESRKGEKTQLRDTLPL